MIDSVKRHQGIDDAGNKPPEKALIEPRPDQYGDRGSYDEYQENRGD